MVRTLFVPLWCWLKALVADRRASPLVENLIIICVVFLILLILLGFITGVFDWVFVLAYDIIEFLDSWTPFPSPNPATIWCNDPTANPPPKILSSSLHPVERYDCSSSIWRTSRALLNTPNLGRWVRAVVRTFWAIFHLFLVLLGVPLFLLMLCHLYL